jgi:hypothetical protein
MSRRGSGSLVYHHVIILLFSLLLLHQPVNSTSTFPNPTPQGNSWGPCSIAVAAINAQGDGTSPGSCLACDPTAKKCPPKCQPLIDTLYASCDGVYTPSGLFFDPNQSISGFWKNNEEKLRIAAQRCGCNTASWGRFSIQDGFVLFLVLLSL